MLRRSRVGRGWGGAWTVSGMIAHLHGSHRAWHFIIDVYMCADAYIVFPVCTKTIGVGQAPTMELNSVFGTRNGCT